MCRSVPSDEEPQMSNTVEPQAQPAIPSPFRVPAVPSPARAARLEALRLELFHLIDDIVTARGEQLSASRARFDVAWKELTAEIDEEPA
jgi:hypothetical protein